MTLLILVLTGIFIAANVYAEWLNRKTMPWWTNPLSAYLAAVPGARVQSAGYIVFAANMVLIAVARGRVVPAILLIGGAIALLNVVWTKWEALRKPSEQAQIMREHVLSAAIAFGLTTVAILTLAWGAAWTAFVLALAAPVSAGLFWWFERADTTLEEKTYTALLLTSLVVLIA